MLPRLTAKIVLLSLLAICSLAMGSDMLLEASLQNTSNEQTEVVEVELVESIVNRRETRRKDDLKSRGQRCPSLAVTSPIAASPLQSTPLHRQVSAERGSMNGFGGYLLS